MPRNAFDGYDEPVNIDMEPEEALKLLLTNSASGLSSSAEPEVQPTEELPIETLG